MAKDFAQLNQYFARMIKDAPEMMEAIVEDVALRVDKEAKKNCPVDTGNLRGSITVDINGVEAEVGTNVEYAPFVEYGTRFMDAQPFVQPALEEQSAKFKSDMQKLVR